MKEMDVRSSQPTLEELEAKMEEAVKAYKELKEKIRACSDKDSEEAFQMGIAEFNLFNYMDMLDEKIQDRRRSLGLDSPK
jgi:hypothetical protein